MKKIVLMSACLLITMMVKAQTILSTDTLTWTSVSSVDLRTDESQNRGGKFITYPNGTIEMVQARYTLMFEQVSTDSVWADLNQPGQLVVSVTFGDKQGLITFGRADDELSITLDFRNEETGIYQKFIITQVE